MTQWHEQSSDSLTEQINAAGSNQSLNTTDSPTFAGLTVSGPTFPSLIHQATATLTDAQIKLWPTSEQEITIVAAPGAGKMFLPQFGFMRSHLVADYESIGAGATIAISAGGFSLAFLTDNHLSSVLSLLNPTAGPTDRVAAFGPSGAVYASETPASPAPFTGDVVVPAVQSMEDSDDLPLIAQMTNDADPLTGGNAANYLRVSVAYFLLNLSTGLFE